MAMVKAAEKEFGSVAVTALPQIIDNIHPVEDKSVKLVVTGVSESVDSINGRILNCIGLKVDGNFVSSRRLGISVSRSGELTKCIPLRIIFQSPAAYLNVLLEVSNCKTRSSRFIAKKFFFIQT